MQVLIITSEWPTPEHPEWVPFIVQQVKYLRQTKVAIEVFVFRGRKNPLNYLKAWLDLRRLYNLKQYDVIHVHWGQSGIIALPTSVPLVVTFHGSDLQGTVDANGRYTIRGALLSLISRFVARQAKEIIVVAEHLRQYLSLQLPAHVIPCGIDLDLFCPSSKADARSRLNLPQNKHLVLFAANPHRSVKRFNLAQDAIVLLKSEIDVDLITLSDVPHTLVPVYMNACDALVLTSKHEGSPTVIKEALACNLPIVSVDVGDVRQRIEKLQGCFLCPDDSPSSIATGLIKVLQAQKPISGRETVADLDERIIVQRIIEVYQAAMHKDQQFV